MESQSQQADFEMEKMQSEMLLPEPLSPQSSYQTRASYSKSRLLTICNVVLFLGTLSMYLKSGKPFSHRPNDVYRASDLYSPIFDQVELESPPSINESLWGADEATTIYNKPPSPEVDAAWDFVSAEDMEIFPITAEDVRKLGKDPDVIVAAPDAWGWPKDTYPAQIDVFHQIHCLDKLRKQIHYNHYYREKFGDNPPELHNAHNGHCLNSVLRSLMCSSSVSIVTYNWREGLPGPYADFNMPRQCRNFEGLLNWVRENGLHNLHKNWQFEVPENAVKLPYPNPRIY